MIINRDTLGHLSNPNFILMKASGERVGVLACTNKSWQKKHNDMDTLSFEIPYLTDAEETLFYEDIDIMKYVEVPSIGVFAIKDVNIVNEGQKNEYKKVECQSRECELGQVYLEDFSINNGTTGSLDGIKFYQPGDQTHSLLHLAVTEKCPGWSFGHISASLWTMKRSFELSRQDVYSFLMSDVMGAFECIFVFDTASRTISAYTESEYGKDTNISVSYNTLLQNTELDYSIDDIKTCVTLKGDDDLSVREINMGYDKIYSFAAFASTDYWSQSLLNAYNAWNTLMNTAVDTSLFTYKTGVITAAELSGKTYKQAYSYLLTKYQHYYTQLSEWNSTKLPYGINTRKNPGYGTVSYTESGSDAIVIERQTATELVTSLPSTGNQNTLYLIKDSVNWDMYRYKNQWVHMNHWYNCALAELKTLQASAEKLQATAMKAGYGDSESTDATIHQRYIDTYLPAYYMYNALQKQIDSVNSTISTLKSDQAIIDTDKNVIVNKTAMRNNFTAAQLKELSSFIREDEITSSNFVVTDEMTESERFDMLNAMLDYGEKELAKVSTPQIQFSCDLINLYAIPEFDNYSGDFDIGNFVWVTIRDDYSIKARILEISINFMDPNDFTVTFGNVVRKAKNIFTDITNALNAATSAATSVSFGSSYWSASAEQTDSIGKALADGLLSQSYYLANAEDNETRIDENGVWITTTTGPHGRDNTDNYDSIYLGGGRILFTEDGWRTVSMSTGRADVQMPSINSSGELVFTKESKFGVFADFLMAGYVGGSLIVGGDIYSSNYKTSSNKNSGNAGTHINLTDGSFEFNDKTAGRKRITLKDNTLEVNGIINAREGHIGSDDNGNGGFIIQNKKLYNGKSTFNGTSRGIYLGSDEGIALGVYNTTTQRNPFSVNMDGYLVANSGQIANFNLNNSSLYTTKTGMSDNNNGIYIGDDGIALGLNNKFYVNTDGYLYSTSGQIGGFNITASNLYNGKESIDSTNAGVYVGTDGISLGAKNGDFIPFKVTSAGALTSKSGTIGGWTINDSSLTHGNISINAGEGKLSFNNKFVINNDGTFTAANQKFSVDVDGNITSTGGTIGGFTITSNSLYKDKTSFYEPSNGLYIGTDGIAFGDDNRFYVHVSGSNSEAKIGNFTIKTNELYNGKDSLYANAEGVYLGINGISLGTLQSDNTTPKFRVTRQGELTATSGHIGGWTIGNYELSSNNIYISSSGSIRHQDGDTSNWGISSSGYAYFKNVFISGVDDDSSFGQMYLNSDGLTFYDSDASSPFEGNCKIHIEELAVGKIVADKADIGWLNADDITADLLSANSIYVDSLKYQGQNVSWGEITYVTGVTLSVENSNTAYVSTRPNGTCYVIDTTGESQLVPTDVGTTSISYYKTIKLTVSKQKSTVLGTQATSGSSSSVSILSIS